MADSVGNMLTIGISGWWRTAEPPTIPSAPTLTVSNDGDGDAITATIEGDAGVTNYVYYQREDATSWTSGGSRAGDGNISIDGLDDGWTYYFYASSQFVGSGYSVASNIVMGICSSTGSDDTIASAGTSPEDVLIEYFSKLDSSDNATKRPVSWYAKIRTDAKPPQEVTAGVVITGSSFSTLEPPSASVYDNTTLFVNKGQIYMVIQRQSPRSLTVRQNMETEEGTYRGSCSAKHNVQPGDHIVDFDGIEYRVLMAEKTFGRSYVSCTLVRISRRTM